MSRINPESEIMGKGVRVKLGHSKEMTDNEQSAQPLI